LLGCGDVGDTDCLGSLIQVSTHCHLLALELLCFISVIQFIPLDWRTYLSPSFTTVPVNGCACIKEEAREYVSIAGWLWLGCCWEQTDPPAAGQSSRWTWSTRK